MAGAQLVVPGVDLARSPRRRADGRESSRDISRRARAPPRGCAATVAARRGRTREGWAMRHGGIDRCPGGAPAAARGQFGGVAVAAGTRKDVRGRGGAREAMAAQ